MSLTLAGATRVLLLRNYLSYKSTWYSLPHRLPRAHRLHVIDRFEEAGEEDSHVLL